MVLTIKVIVIMTIMIILTIIMIITIIMIMTIIITKIIKCRSIYRMPTTTNTELLVALHNDL